LEGDNERCPVLYVIIIEKEERSALSLMEKRKGK